VPTQIVTEYFRHRFLYEYEPGKKSQIHGILYPSSKANDGINAVLFFDRFSCEGIVEESVYPKKKMLRLLTTETLAPLP
jgi:hypothetical protein